VESVSACASSHWQSLTESGLHVWQIGDGGESSHLPARSIAESGPFRMLRGQANGIGGGS
jgi:hypothetical protein